MRFRALAVAAFGMLALGFALHRTGGIRRTFKLLPSPVRTAGSKAWRHLRGWDRDLVPSVQAAPLAEPADVGFRLQCVASEFRSLHDGAAIRPAVIPPGLKGRVSVEGSGAFKLGPSGGCTFLHGGQQRQNTAWLQFTGRAAGDLFDSSSVGSFSVTVRSLISFKDRLDAATRAPHNYRQLVDVYDDDSKQLEMSITPHDGQLAIIYSVGAGPQRYYFFKRNSEDELFGAGVPLKLKLAWDGRGTSQLIVNDQVVETATYGRAHPVWSARSSFSIGARDIHEYNGGFFSASDMALSDIAVHSSGPYKDTVPPQLTFRSPADGQKISGSVFLEADASDDEGVTQVRFLADGAPLAPAYSYPYRCFWDAHALPPGRHVLTAEASDAAGNVARKEIAVNVEPAPAPDTEPPAPVSSVYTAALRPREIRIYWPPSTDNTAVGEYRVYRNGQAVGSVKVPAVQPPEPVAFTDSGVEPGQAYAYQVEAIDTAGNAAPLGAPLVLTPPASAGNILRVGPKQKYTTPCAAIGAARAGDTVEIDAAGTGTYDGDACGWSTDRLTIRGVNGRPHIAAHGHAANEKGLWVVSGRNNTIENVEISGASVGDHNGSAIRLEGRDAVIRHVYFHDNQDGILATVEGGSLLIEFSEFGNNGDGSGQSHNLYITNLDRFVFRYNYSHHAKIGHLLKTRAARNEILYNRLSDDTGGTASYELDMPNGGMNYIIGNIIQQSTTSDNENIVSYGTEGLRPNVPHGLYFIGNTVADERPGGHFFHVAAAPPRVVAVNNIFAGATSVLELPPGSDLRNNLTRDPGFVNAAARDYRLNSNSPAIGAAIPVGPLPPDTPALEPVFHYAPVAGGSQRKAGAKGNIGAL